MKSKKTLIQKEKDLEVIEEMGGSSVSCSEKQYP